MVAWYKYTICIETTDCYTFLCLLGCLLPHCVMAYILGYKCCESSVECTWVKCCVPLCSSLICPILLLLSSFIFCFVFSYAVLNFLASVSGLSPTVFRTNVVRSVPREAPGRCTVLIRSWTTAVVLLHTVDWLICDKDVASLAGSKFHVIWTSSAL
jgi:hypothetical protein